MRPFLTALTLLAASAGAAALAPAWAAEEKPATGAPERTAEEKPTTDASEHERISCDRPGATDSSETVGEHRIQLELGVEADQNRVDDVRLEELRTPFQLRFGITENLEASIFGDGLVYDTSRPTGGPTDSQGDRTDLVLRLRYHFMDKGGEGSPYMPSSAVFFDLGIPTGSERIRESGVFPAMKVAFDWGLPADLGFGLNCGWAIARDDDGDRALVETFAVNLSRPLTPLTEDVGAYISAGSTVPGSSRGHVVSILDGGIVVFPHDLVQVDAFAQTGLNKDGPDIAVGFGISVKLP